MDAIASQREKNPLVSQIKRPGRTHSINVQGVNNEKKANDTLNSPTKVSLEKVFNLRRIPTLPKKLRLKHKSTVSDINIIKELDEKVERMFSEYYG